MFEWPAPGETLAEVEQRDQHGGRQEVRHLWTSHGLNGNLDWPGVQQVCKIERTVRHKGQVTREVRYGITSLGPQVRPAGLLGLWRGHWGIENRLHYVRDVAFGEDSSPVRTGAAPQVLAVLRNLVLALLRNAGYANSAAPLREHAWSQPSAALRLLGIALA